MAEDPHSKVASGDKLDTKTESTFSRNWATENEVESSVLDSLLQREEQEDDSAVTLSELKKQEKVLAKKMKTETYVVSSFKGNSSYTQHTLH